MPSLRPLTDVARTDARFFGDSVVPALAAAGFDGSIALLVTDAPDACVGDVVGADVIVEGTHADIEALLAGKQKTELNALDKLKAAKRASSATTSTGTGGVQVRGTAEALRALVDATAPRDKAQGGGKDIASEAGAVPRARPLDLVRTAEGRYIKGLRRGSGRRTAPPSAPRSSVVGAQKSGATDRVGFALQNLAGFVSAGLARLGPAGALDDDGEVEDGVAGHGVVFVVTPGEVRRG